MLTAGSLFAGYGGIELALSSVLDVRPAWFVEFDKAPSKVLAHHWPDVPNYGDVTTVDWSTVEPVDIITGGFPCQDLSHAGKRAGITGGARSSLFAEVIAAVAHLRPALVVLENVRGLLSGKDTIDAPIDTCLCGWTYRWGGLRTDSGVEGSDLSPLGDDRHDGEGSGGAASDAAAIRRGAEVCSTCDGEVGRGVCLDCGRGCCDDATHGHLALLDLEGRAGSDRTEGCSDSGRPPSALGAEPERAEALDGRGSDPLRSAEASDARTECEGSGEGVFDIATGERATHCPSCGRRVGGAASRSIQRSWMGTVLRSLAHIGYVTRFYSLRAADVGAAHGRFRVFLFAVPADSDDQGLQGLAGQARTASTGRHGHPVAGVGGSALTLLPTPKASNNENRSSGWANGPNLGEALALLPTPSVADGMGGHLTRSGDRSNELLLPGVAKAHQQAWGQYAAAIARAEQAIGRPAPPPTEIGPKGAPRLSPRFVEFLMMLPEGWVTDVAGLTRNELLKMLGNGVVPAQCAAALRAFLWDAYGIGAAA